MRPPRRLRSARMRTLIVVVILLVAGFFGAQFYIQHRAAENIDTVVSLLSPYAELKYGNVTATLSGELKIERISGKIADYHDSFTIDSVTLITPGFGFLLGFDRHARDFDVPESFGIE